MIRAAVIGAGLAGLRVAHRLAEAGAQVRVFEKARGAGGRPDVAISAIVTGKQ